MLRLLIVIVACACLIPLLIPFSVLAQEPIVVPRTTTVSTTPVARHEVQDSNETAEVIALRAQVETMRQYHEQILATVYWALGGSLAILAGIVLVSWYFNFRVYARDKEVMKQALFLAISTELEAIKREILSRVEQEAELIKKRIERELDFVKQQLERGIEGIEYQRKREQEWWENKVKGIEINLLETEAELYRQRGEHTNTLRFYNRALGLIKKQFGTLRIPSILEKMQVALQDGAMPDAQLVAEVSENLQELPAQYALEVDSVRQLLNAGREK